MAKSITMTVRLKPEVSERLEMLARDTKRSKAYLASEAIEAYVELNSWQVAHIKRALEEDESSVPGVPHEEVVSLDGIVIHGARRWLERADNHFESRSKQQLSAERD